MEIIHKSKLLPGTVEKNSSTIKSSAGIDVNHDDLPSIFS